MDGAAPPDPALVATAVLNKAGVTMIMILVCFLAPWLAMFIRGHVVQGILCILLHLTLIGWIPATIWALIVCRRDGVI